MLKIVYSFSYRLALQHKRKVVYKINQINLKNALHVPGHFTVRNRITYCFTKLCCADSLLQVTLNLYMPRERVLILICSVWLLPVVSFLLRSRPLKSKIS